MLCLDTYALVELETINPKYSFLLNKDFVIPDTTMAEFYTVLLQKHDERTADYWHRKFSAFCRPVSREVLIKAVKFRKENRGMSFFDCVGYMFALENNIKFVTGDKAFKGRKGVEYVK